MSDTAGSPQNHPSCMFIARVTITPFYLTSNLIPISSKIHTHTCMYIYTSLPFSLKDFELKTALLSYSSSKDFDFEKNQNSSKQMT